MIEALAQAVVFTGTGAQPLLQQQHLVAERFDSVASAPQLCHLFWLQLFRRHGQHRPNPGPGLTGPLGTRDASGCW